MFDLDACERRGRFLYDYDALGTPNTVDKCSRVAELGCSPVAIRMAKDDAAAPVLAFATCFATAAAVASFGAARERIERARFRASPCSCRLPAGPRRRFRAL